jgi:hypothetical protein
LISGEDAVETLDFGFVNISIEGEAVTYPVRSWIFATESVSWELLVMIVILKNVTNCLNSLEIGVFLRLPVMERICHHRFTV